MLFRLPFLLIIFLSKHHTRSGKPKHIKSLLINEVLALLKLVLLALL